MSSTHRAVGPALAGLATTVCLILLSGAPIGSAQQGRGIPLPLVAAACYSSNPYFATTAFAPPCSRCVAAVTAFHRSIDASDRYTLATRPSMAYMVPDSADLAGKSGLGDIDIEERGGAFSHVSLKIVVDMNLSPEWVAVFQDEGWGAVHWSAIGDPRASDRIIMRWAAANSHVAFTHDLDFGTLLAVTGATGPSVIQVRAQNVMPDH